MNLTELIEGYISFSYSTADLMVHCTLIIDGASQVSEVFDDFHFILANKGVITWLVITWQHDLGLLITDIQAQTSCDLTNCTH